MDSENTTTERNFFEKLGQSLLTAFLTVLFFIFVLPWKLWTHSVNGLGAQSANDTFKDDMKTDLPLLNSYVTLWSAMVVVIPILTLVWFLIIFPMMTWGFRMVNFEYFIVSVATAYYSPVIAALIKELIYLSVSIANNLKKIAESK